MTHPADPQNEPQRPLSRNNMFVHPDGTPWDKPPIGYMAAGTILGFAALGLILAFLLAVAALITHVAHALTSLFG